jgi:hypothetical protein
VFRRLSEFAKRPRTDRGQCPPAYERLVERLRARAS